MQSAKSRTRVVVGCDIVAILTEKEWSHMKRSVPFESSCLSILTLVAVFSYPDFITPPARVVENVMM